jgi:hypothetical protein
MSQTSSFIQYWITTDLQETTGIAQLLRRGSITGRLEIYFLLHIVHSKDYMATGWKAGVRFPSGATGFSLLRGVHTGPEAQLNK